jgi:hypothetical protein
LKKTDAALVTVTSGTCSNPTFIDLAKTDIIEVDTTSAEMFSLSDHPCDGKKTIFIKIVAQPYSFTISCSDEANGNVVSGNDCTLKPCSNSFQCDAIGSASCLNLPPYSLIVVCRNIPGKVLLIKK